MAAVALAAITGVAAKQINRNIAAAKVKIGFIFSLSPLQ